jgi:hypothetical protein
VALKMDTDLLNRVRECAKEEDRTVSSFLRRLIAAAVVEPTTVDRRQL